MYAKEFLYTKNRDYLWLEEIMYFKQYEMAFVTILSSLVYMLVRALEGLARFDVGHERILII
jgi:hypothetical protein